MPLHPLLTGHPYRPPARPAPPLRGPPLPLETVAATVAAEVVATEVGIFSPSVTAGALERTVISAFERLGVEGEEEAGAGEPCGDEDKEAEQEAEVW